MNDLSVEERREGVLRGAYIAKKETGAEKQRAVLRTSAIVAVVFLLLVVGLVVLTFSLGTKLGLDLTF